MPFRVRPILQVKFYLFAFTSTIRFGFRLRLAKLGWKQRVFLAFILSKANDRERLKALLATEEGRSVLGHMARHLFLISQASKCRVGLDGTDLRIEISKGGKDYQFNLLALPDKSKAAFVHDLTPLSEIFFLGTYDFYNYRGGIVIDIGGYIGDTAVYFAKNGAREVYTYEPNPVNFAYLTRNVELNRVGNEVKAFNCAVSQERKKLAVPQWGGAGSVFAKKEKLSSYDVANIKPTEILNEKQEVSLLKVDCKGCESELFRIAIDEVSKKTACIIIDAERLGFGERREMIARLENSGFLLDAETNNVLYLRNRKMTQELREIGEAGQCSGTIRSTGTFQC